jgi:hypothetical protein
MPEWGTSGSEGGLGHKAQAYPTGSQGSGLDGRRGFGWVLLN